MTPNWIMGVTLALTAAAFLASACCLMGLVIFFDKRGVHPLITLFVVLTGAAFVGGLVIP